MAAKAKAVEEELLVEGGELAVVIERLSNLQDDISEIKVDIKEQRFVLEEQSETVQAFLLNYTKEHGEVVNTAKRAHERIDATNIRVETVEKKVVELEKLAPFLKVEAFLVAGLSIPLIIWLADILWKLLTHQIELPGL